MGKSRRIGRFTLPFDLVMNSSADLGNFFAGFRILRAEGYPLGSTIEYTALCDEFDEVGHGEIIPRYDVTVHTWTETHYNGHTIERAS